MVSVSIARNELLTVLQESTPFKPLSKSSKETLKRYALTKALVDGSSSEEFEAIKALISSFVATLHKKWIQSSKRLYFVVANSAEWLKEKIVFEVPLHPNHKNVVTPEKVAGRPKKSYSESSPRSRHRKVQDIISKYTTEEIIHASHIVLNKKGQRKDSRLLRGKLRPRTVFKDRCRPYSPEDALDLIVRLKLTMQDYQLLRNDAVHQGTNLYPAYHRVCAVKKLCYPSEDSKDINEKYAQVKLQNLLDHKATRIAESQKGVIEQQINFHDQDSLKLTCKWGLDGSSSQSTYKQKFSGKELFDDSSVFITSLVPIQLSAIPAAQGKDQMILWQNPHPSSTRYCRPIKFSFENETTELTKEEVSTIEMQIKQLLPTEICLSKFRVKTGLIIDRPKQGGGNSNDGNTARLFFADPKQSADITGVDEELIRRFSVILRAISTGYEVDPQKFQTYAKETVELYRKLYDWYYLPSSVHKILMHGAQVMESFLVPIGQLSEEASEARNKHFRYYRKHNTRKISREKNNEDLFKLLLISSDPFISSKIPSSRKKCAPILEEVMSLLRSPSLS